MRSVSEPICSRMGSRAGQSASGTCSLALLWKLLAGHLGKRAPKDLTAPLTWLTSCVRLATKACRERMIARCAWEPSPRCLSGYKSFGSEGAPGVPQVLGVDLILFVLVSVDEPQLTGVGHQNLVATRLQHPANPRRVGSGLDG